jgi:hypothetical protein
MYKYHKIDEPMEYKQPKFNQLYVEKEVQSIKVEV